MAQPAVPEPTAKATDPQPEPTSEDRLNSFLAFEMDETGDPAAAPPPSGDPPPPAAETPTEEEASPESEEDPSGDPEAGSEGEPEPAAAEVEGGDPPDDGIHTLSDLAQSLEVEEAEFLQHITVEDGEGNSHPLSDVLTNWREQPAATQDRDELNRIMQGLHGKEAQMQVQHEAKLAEMQQATQRVLAYIETEQSVDWEELKEQDPSRYLLVRQQFQDRAAAVQDNMNRMRGEFEERQKHQQEARLEWQREEVQKLRRLHPDLGADPEKWKGHIQSLQAYLTHQNFAPEEQEYIEDHRWMLIVDKARKFDELHKKVPVTRERVRRLPKAVVPGARRPTANPQKKQYDDSRRALAESGDERDAARAFEAGGFV